jgi:hypothetical protein
VRPVHSTVTLSEPKIRASALVCLPLSTLQSVYIVGRSMLLTSWS